MPAMTDAFISQLETIAGHRFVVTGEDKTRRFATGFRYGGGRVLAVVRPGTLVEQWRVLQACAAAGKIVIMQAANTGLTGGSTPDGEEDGFACGNELLATAGLGEQLARGEDLVLTWLDHSGLCDEPLSHCGTKATD